MSCVFITATIAQKLYILREKLVMDTRKVKQVWKCCKCGYTLKRWFIRLIDVEVQYMARASWKQCASHYSMETSAIHQLYFQRTVMGTQLCGQLRFISSYSSLETQVSEADSQ